VSLDRVWNVDETAVRLLPLNDRGWSQSGQRAHFVSDKKRLVTVTLACCMAGGPMLSQVIFKGLTARSLPQTPLPFGMEATVTENHWIDIPSMRKLLLQMDAHLNPHQERAKWLLLLDVAPVHVSAAFKQLRDEEFPWILLIFVAPNMTATSQPLDRSYMFAFKRAMARSASEFFARHAVNAYEAGEEVKCDTGALTLKNKLFGWIREAMDDLEVHRGKSVHPNRGAAPAAAAAAADSVHPNRGAATKRKEGRRQEQPPGGRKAGGRRRQQRQGVHPNRGAATGRKEGRRQTCTPTEEQPQGGRKEGGRRAPQQRSSHREGGREEGEVAAAAAESVHPNRGAAQAALQVRQDLVESAWKYIFVENEDEETVWTEAQNHHEDHTLFRAGARGTVPEWVGAADTQLLDEDMEEEEDAEEDEFALLGEESDVEPEPDIPVSAPEQAETVVKTEPVPPEVALVLSAENKQLQKLIALSLIYGRGPPKTTPTAGTGSASSGAAPAPSSTSG
jgi:hypothetical protein